MAKDKVIKSETIYKGSIVNVRLDTFQQPSGKQTTREIVEHSEVIVAVPLDARGNVLMVRQFREAVGKSLLELPAGGMEPGETPEACVERELREEIGYLPKKVERLTGFYSAPGYCTEYLHLFLASELERAPLTAEDTAGIEVVCVSFKETLKLIASGEICDSKSIAGLLFCSALAVFKE
ncbi:MAG: NUDIX hydrolase [Dehalococcoidia bacterium]|nr:NUDIX hydrolase [Dehalococcoidia bacterium]